MKKISISFFTALVALGMALGAAACDGGSTADAGHDHMHDGGM